MKFLNIRLMHATNSSSSHSIIVAGSHTAGWSAERGNFNWNNFLQTTQDDKISYMAQQLYGNLFYHCGEDVAKAVILGFWGQDRVQEVEGGGVDHQSDITMPFYHLGKGFGGGSSKPAVDFYKELCDAIASDPSVDIRGGNDNDGFEDDERGNTDTKYSFFLNHMREVDQPQKNLIVRKQNNVWTLYNPKSGTKIHIDFMGKDNAASANYRPTSPELVDVKITDYCPYGCAYCYQGSTKEGKHAPLNKIKEIIDQLAYNEVFEIAFGGGETTQHPDFAEILRYTRSKGITPNFTTKSRSWLLQKEVVEAVRDYAGAFAFSVENKDAMVAFDKTWEKARQAYNIYNVEHTYQYIPDAFPMENFNEVIEQAAKSWKTITLLGYKTTGRGGVRPHNNIAWLDKVQSMKNKPRLGIDTVMAEQYEEELKKHKIDERLYYKEEGRFSMYIDAVEMKIARSSFVPPSEMVGVTSAWAMLDIFRNWQEKAH